MPSLNHMILGHMDVSNWHGTSKHPKMGLVWHIDAPKLDTHTHLYLITNVKLHT